MCFDVGIKNVILFLWRIEIIDMNMIEFYFLNNKNDSLFLD